jgi:aromatic ring-opening dioxygenase LigB subunit
MESEKEIIEEIIKNQDEILSKINTKFIFEFSEKCYRQLKLMEFMLKEERFKP